LPTLLKYAENGKWNTQEQNALQELKKWNYLYKANQIAPTLFYVWWNNLEQSIWLDELDRGKGFRFPVNDRTLELVMAGDSLGKRWFDDVNTLEKETLQDLVIASLHKTMKDLQARFKDNDMKKWAWATYRDSRVNHLLRLPAFSVTGITSDGDRTTVNAVDVGSHGPSWRMVVALGRNPKGLGVFPGGQSGNPGSHFYANFMEKWQKGELYELLYLKKAEKNAKIISYWKLSK
jgi:penicillin amidase